MKDETFAYEMSSSNHIASNNSSRLEKRTNKVGPHRLVLQTEIETEFGIVDLQEEPMRPLQKSNHLGSIGVEVSDN
jgi:hypothetical protein